jgi:predicted NBD/HSP70 family sugar kinase
MLTRYRDPRVTPIEVWDLVVDGVPLYDVPRDASFGRALARYVEALVDGAASSESGEVFPSDLAAIEHVVLLGGAASAVEWSSRRLRAELAPDHARCAEPGGRAICERNEVRRGAVVDLGQSVLKIATPRWRRSYPRDFDAIPISTRPIDARGREACLAFVSDALRDASTTEPDGIVFAVPCAVSAAGELATCSYPWQAGDDFVHAVLRRAGLADVPTWILNDAELAAIGVARDRAIRSTTLALTLGFGVGAALIHGER